jgi:hypothetical protein
VLNNGTGYSSRNTLVSAKSALNIARGNLSWHVRSPFYPHSGQPVIPFEAYYATSANNEADTTPPDMISFLIGDLAANFFQSRINGAYIATQLALPAGWSEISGTNTIGSGGKLTIPSGAKVLFSGSLGSTSSTNEFVLNGLILVSGSGRQISNLKMTIQNAQTNLFQSGFKFDNVYLDVKGNSSVKFSGNVIQTNVRMEIASGSSLDADGLAFSGNSNSYINSNGKISIKNSSFTKSGTATFPYVALNGAGADGSIFENVTINGSTYGIHCYNAGTIVLNNVQGNGNFGQVVKLTNTSAYLNGGSFTNSTWDGIALYEGAWMAIAGSPVFTNSFMGIRAARGSHVYFSHQLNESANMHFEGHTHSGVAAYTNSGIDLGVQVPTPIGYPEEGPYFYAGYNTFNNSVRQVYVRQNSYVHSFATTLAGAGILDGEAGSVINLEYFDPSPIVGPLKATAESDPLVWLENQPVRTAEAMQVYHKMQRSELQKARAGDMVSRKVNDLKQADWTVPAMLEAQRAGRETEALALAERITKGNAFGAEDQKSAWYLLFRTAIDRNDKNAARKALRELKKLKHEDAENGFCDLLLDGSGESGNEISRAARNDHSALVTAFPNPFNPSTNLTVTLAQQENLTLAVYDLNGRRIMQLASGVFQQGAHTFRFDASKLASGMYLWRLQTGAGIQSGKITLLK